MQGHEVRTAHDGIEALDMLRDFAPDVAILDIGMPKMNGYTLAARIRENMREAQPLLIAVTGWGQEDARRRSKAAGFDHHLVKPVDPGALAALLAVPSGRTLH
jgi:CheY-like chemotaxis protein